MDTNILKEVLKLPDAEKLELIGDLWDSLSNPNDIPLTDEQKEELDRRLEAHYKNPESGSSWDEVKARILGSK
ncbi:MAG TPA: addiction module protein [Ignavibacteria bacterium]|nr:addiction module protein [Ignavibacteria bacterium]HMR00396.1 addiction module protein [Ignavibacteria bacterium]